MKNKQAIVIKNRILLPNIYNRKDGKYDIQWTRAQEVLKDDSITDILIEKTDNRFKLYGTNIPGFLVNIDWYPQVAQFKKNYFFGINCIPFCDRDPHTHYTELKIINGEYISGETLINWLENEKNIESMKKLVQYIKHNSLNISKINKYNKKIEKNNKRIEKNRENQSLEHIKKLVKSYK